MESEAILKAECQRLEKKIRETEEVIQDYESKLCGIPKKMADEKNKLVAEYKSLFEKKNERDLVIVKESIEGKLREIERLVDSFPDIDKREIAGKVELVEVVEKLEESYPEGLIRRYSDTNLREYDSDDEAFDDYVRLEQMVGHVSNVAITGMLFDKITSALEAIVSRSSGCIEGGEGGDDGGNSQGIVGIQGKKDLIVGICLAGAILLSTVFSPFACMTLLMFFTLVGVVSGARAKRCFNLLYSLREYLNTEYNVEVFQEDKSQVLDRITAYLDGVEDEYKEEIAGRRFIMNKDALSAIVKKFGREREEIESQKKAMRIQFDNLSAEFKRKCEEYEQVKQDNLNKAEALKRRIFSVLDWKRQWLNDILVDIIDNSKIMKFTNTKANTIFYSAFIESVQEFSKLYIYQMLMHVHPDYMVQVVLDYKYMGGGLTQLASIPDGAFRVCCSDEDISNRVEVLSQEMRARASNILSSCENIEAFNKLMEEYDSNGEVYMVVHVFGLSQFNDMFKFFVKNGGKVGMFFKFYMTKEEMKVFKDSMPWDDIDEFFEVGDVVVKRSKQVVYDLITPQKM